MNTDRVSNYNVGDLSLLPGEERVEIVRKNVLVVGDQAIKVNPNDFDEVVLLGGPNFSEEQESKVREETTK